MHRLPCTGLFRARFPARRTTRRAVTGLLLAVLVLGCAASPPEIERARNLYERGAYGDAALAADRALERYPDHPEPWRIKIQAALAQRDARQAVAIYGQWHARRQGHDHQALDGMAVATLWQGLRVPSGTIRVQAIQIIERIEIEKLARDVTRLLGDDDDLVAAAAAVAVLRSDFNAPDIATQLLRSDIAEARALVVAGIGRKVRGAARGDLVAALDDPAPVVRQAAIRAIAGLTDAGDTRRLVAFATGDPDGAVRTEALRALGQPGRQGQRAELSGPLERALADAHPDARRAAIIALDAHDMLEPVRRAASSDDLAIALPAAAALHRRSMGTFAPLLARALADPAPALRAAALDVAAALVSRAEAEASARAALSDAEETVRLAAARTLAALEGAGGLDALAALASHATGPNVREAAVRALGLARKPTMGMVVALADPTPRVRLTAAETILRVID